MSKIFDNKPCIKCSKKVAGCIVINSKMYPICDKCCLTWLDIRDKIVGEEFERFIDLRSGDSTRRQSIKTVARK